MEMETETAPETHTHMRKEECGASSVCALLPCSVIYVRIAALLFDPLHLFFFRDVWCVPSV